MYIYRDFLSISVDASICCSQYKLKDETAFQDIAVDVLWGGMAKKQLDNPQAVRSKLILLTRLQHLNKRLGYILGGPGGLIMCTKRRIFFIWL